MKWNYFVRYYYNYSIQYSACIHNSRTAEYSQSGGLRAERLGNVLSHNCQDRINLINLDIIDTLVSWVDHKKQAYEGFFGVTRQTIITSKSLLKNTDARHLIQSVKLLFTSSCLQDALRDTQRNSGLECTINTNDALSALRPPPPREAMCVRWLVCPQDHTKTDFHETWLGPCTRIDLIDPSAAKCLISHVQ